MVHRVIRVGLLLCGTLSFSVHAKSTWGEFKSTMTGIGDSVKSFGMGMAESFGMNPPDYEYSFRVFNDSSESVTVQAHRIKSFQGIKARKGTIKEMTLTPSQDTGQTGFNALNLYLDVELKWPEGSFTESITKLAAKHDKTIYHFHVFETKAGIAAENIGKGYTTTDLYLGSIYNSLSTVQTVSFDYAGQRFSVVLDKDSHNMLQSDKDIPHCMRPVKDAAFIDCGTAGKISVLSAGLATGKEDKGVWTNVMPLQYHHEIIENVDKSGKAVTKVVTAGFNPGNYTQPTNKRVRNITPIRCSVWNTSAAQATSPVQEGQLLTSISIDQGSRSVWCVYSTPGWSNKTFSVNDTVMVQIPAGKAVEWYIMRPSIDGSKYLTSEELLTVQETEFEGSEKIDSSPIGSTSSKTTKQSTDLSNKKSSQESQDQSLVLNLSQYIKTTAPQTTKAELYIVSLDTIDEKKARQFLQNLIDGKLPKPARVEFNTQVTDGQLGQTIKNTLFANKLPENQGLINDTQSGVSGFILNYDLFTAYGAGQGPYYYTLYPPKVTLSNLYVHSLGGYMRRNAQDGSGNQIISDEDQAAAYKALADWVTKAAQSQTINQAIKNLRPQVEKFLQEYGMEQLFVKNNTSSKTFSSLGMQAVGMILTGPNSITKAPLIYSAGTNNYVYTYGSVPGYKDKTGKQVVTWQPSETIDLAGKVIISQPKPVETQDSTPVKNDQE